MIENAAHIGLPILDKMKGVLESIGTDKTFSSKYGSHDCPDKSANGMFSYAKSKGCAWGTIDTLPEVPGVALRFDRHVGVCVVCNSGSVNIRVGNGTQYDRVTAAKNGASFEWVATAENGWHAIVVNGRVGWVSGKYSKTE